MQIGIDLGATKIEYVLLDNKNKELERNREETPKNFQDTVSLIVKITKHTAHNFSFSVYLTWLS